MAMRLVSKNASPAIHGYRNVPLVQGVAYPSRTIPRSQVQDLKRAYDADLYDANAITIAAGPVIAASQNLQMYTQGLGQGVSPIYGGALTKTEADTNVRVSGGMLSLKQAFLADELGFNCIARPGQITSANGSFVAIDQGSVMTGFSVIYKSSSTEIIMGLIVDWPAGYGIWSGGAATTVAATSIAQANNGFPALNARWKLRMPKDFSAGEDFRLVINNAGPITALSAAGTVFVVRSTYGGVWRDKVA